jgi:tripartite-type tricarboxylate transporter receptor subunit TctC
LTHAPVLVENKAGASGMIGAEWVAKSKPDGKTLLIGGNGPVVLNQALFSKMPYDPEKSFIPVVGLAKSPMLMFVRKNLDISNFESFLQRAKLSETVFSMGSAGIGNITHITGEYASALIGFKTHHIPFSGSAPAVTAVAGGNVDLMFDPLPSSMQLAKSGMTSPLAIMDDQRFPSLPHVPTLKEVGYDNMEISAWFVLMAPAQTPASVVQELNQLVNQVLAMPHVVTRLQAIGEQPLGGMSPAQVASFVKSERDRWIPLIKKLGIKPE